MRPGLRGERGQVFQAVTNGASRPLLCGGEAAARLDTGG